LSFTVDGRAVTASDDRVLQRLLVKPGTLIQARYNLKNPREVLIGVDASGAELQRAYDAWCIATSKVTQEVLDVVEKGVRAQGVVISAQPTGIIVRGCGEMALHVQVSSGPHSDSWGITVTKVIPREALHEVQPGRVLDVFYLPGDENHLVIALPVPENVTTHWITPVQQYV